ncbi:helix-turn-helix domain-containing protein [Nakamurella lactea]|uniref:helix-turn-helix domain-containing protein n=1 Tax=Nakamurella lactea TaxID=459515 RepID=UPI00042255DF|nr:helix-turn-helix transcriptional regulator [Nakamurella lactea]
MDLVPMLGPVRELGEFIRDQRTSAQLSLRALADKAGISNPYLSQVERGLRKPSAEILAQIAQGLSISAESLLAKAGLLPERSTEGVVAAIEADPALTARQKAALTDIYRAFVADHQPPPDAGDAHPNPTTTATATTATATTELTDNPVTEGD